LYLRRFNRLVVTMTKQQDEGLVYFILKHNECEPITPLGIMLNGGWKRLEWKVVPNKHEIKEIICYTAKFHDDSTFPADSNPCERCLLQVISCAYY
jgi:hypothetical protein